MDNISSTEFRKRFAKLAARTQVTVHGHVIGEWVPVDSAGYRTVAELKAELALPDYPTGRFGTPRPVPKPGKK